MPKIKDIQTGAISEKSSLWITLNHRTKGEVWELYTEKSEGVFLSDGNDSAEVAYSKLSDGDKQSISRGAKKLVRRKAGWLVIDCGDKCLEEIHITLPARESAIKSAKDSASTKAQAELRLLAGLKSILRNVLRNELNPDSEEGYKDFYVTCEDFDSEDVDKYIAKLSLGSTEVEALKMENDRLKDKIKKSGLSI